MEVGGGRGRRERGRREEEREEKYQLMLTHSSQLPINKDYILKCEKRSLTFHMWCCLIPRKRLGSGKLCSSTSILSIL